MPVSGLMREPPPTRLHLPQVTLCAASSANIPATIAALKITLARVRVADAVLFTDAQVDPAHLLGSAQPIRLVPIDRLGSAAAYSDFMLTRAVDQVNTSHALIIQWDGHVIDAAGWLPEFLDYDYIGARWPQFDDGRDVGNGGFCLRSRRLMEACRTPKFVRRHPEDVAICRTNRALLDAQGMRFAPAALADRFAAERAGDPATSFGYHGVFLMPRVLGADGFWQVYRTLDERSSLRRDFRDLLKAVHNGPDTALRSLRMIVDAGRDWLRRRRL